MKNLLLVLLIICLSALTAEASNKWISEAYGLMGIRPDNMSQEDFWVSKIDTTDFRKECKSVTYTDEKIKAKVTVDSCKWTAVCDTTFEEKIALRLSRPQLDWLLKWLTDAMKPRERFEWGAFTVDTIEATSLVGNAIGWTGSAWSPVAMDSITVDTVSIKKIQ